VLALNETEPAFDAANCLKANDHILYLVSNSGNLRGCDKLQEIMGHDVKVHPLHDVYAFTHIDSTICFLREGLLMINPSRVKDIHDLPHPFNTWDVINCPEPEGYQQPSYAYCSPWVLNMNLISINERLVIVEENQHQLRKLLSVQGIESLVMPGRQMIKMGGGPHCCSLDIDRD
jgi:N-dimethylarginine dimethylaminohydrolase